MASRTNGRGMRRFAIIILVLSVLAVTLLAAMGPAWQAGLLDLGTIFGTIFPNVAYAALGLAAIALIGLVFSGARGRVGAAMLFGLALALSGGAGWKMNDLRQTGQSVPPIHDVTTDPDTPPQFATLSPERPADELRVPARPCPEDAAESCVDMSDMTPQERWRAYHDAAYGDLESLSLSIPPRAALALSERAARDMGWEIVASVPQAGRIEATATTDWFGFKDDVVIRIAATEAGTSVIDIRSVSRIGVSDLGANAERIRVYLDTLKGLAPQNS